MTVDISLEKLSEYREGARRRKIARQSKLDEQFQRAWAIARQGATLLKNEFGGQKVVAFGSLINRARFHERSDIDLAIWGIAEKDYLRALGRLLDLTTEFSIDLVRVEEAHTYLHKTIDTEGVVL